MGSWIVPAVFWIGHLVAAVCGFAVLRRHASGVPANMRTSYLVAGSALVLLALIPGAFASMFTVGLALGTMVVLGVPVGAEGAAALAAPFGLMTVALIIYLVVRLTRTAFARGGTVDVASADRVS